MDTVLDARANIPHLIKQAIYTEFLRPILEYTPRKGDLRNPITQVLYHLNSKCPPRENNEAWNDILRMALLLVKATTRGRDGLHYHGT